ncbi:transcriptional regulator [Tersicoccus solisilvae]|uniref:Manganese transport regulator n=1 Tax=Tersicoccus solisilvae TaxID=1882339 RepID=A0ABQ1NXN1_9MICC|nr:transcriptional regulator [Tersicoccus solisilvae]
MEDYVKAIHAHTEWNPGPITTTALAARLRVTAASASEMVRRLDERGLVVHRPYRPVELTPAGRALAVAMIRRHRLLETWLASELGYGWDEVHDEAERLEHAVSDRLIEAIAERLGDPERDPHGDPIPRRDGAVVVPDARPLAGFDAGHPVRVRRVSDADPALLRALAAARIGPDTDLTVLDPPDDRRASGAVVRVRVVGAADAVLLARQDAAAVWVADRGEHDGCTLTDRPVPRPRQDRPAR